MFDHIIVALATIAALQLLLPRPAARAHATALMLMKRCVKAAHGVSKHFCHAMKEFLLFGAGQGSRASPATWLTIAARPLSVLTAMAPMAMSFADPWSEALNKRDAGSHVNDSSAGCNDDAPRAGALQRACQEQPGGGPGMGATPAQLEQSAGAEKVPLVPDALAMGQWATGAGTKPELPRSCCTNLRKHSRSHGGPKGGSVGSEMSPWHATST